MLNDSLFSSTSQHYATPGWVVPLVYKLFGGAPCLDPASNPWSQVEASYRWTLRMTAWRELRRFTRKSGRFPSVSEAAGIRLVVQNYNRRSRLAGMLFRDALGSPWPFVGFGYCNPPYDRVAPFMHRVAGHAALYHSEWCCLVASRTSSSWWHESIFGSASAVLYFRGRLSFQVFGKATGQAPFDSALVYYGARPRVFSDVFSSCGRVSLHP